MKAPTKYLLLVANLVLQVTGTMFLKEAALRSGVGWLTFGTLIALGLAASGLRFVVWGRLTKSHELNRLYPLTTVVYPVILFISVIVYGSTFSPQKVCGVILILLGIVFLERETARTNA